MANANITINEGVEVNVSASPDGVSLLYTLNFDYTIDGDTLTLAIGTADTTTYKKINE